MLDTLFGLIPAESHGQQWVARDLQLVNWGGYDGWHSVRFSPHATLFTGGSGSGKSTMMDAYIALMMPHTTPFNGASNGGVQGRPRGDDQRNILSYARGKLDETLTEGGTKVNVLRGDGVDTWTAIAMTWADHDGSRFTALRAWYVPAAARALEDAVRVRATVDGPFDLKDLQPAVGSRLADAAVRSAGLDTYATDREFTAKLHATLGIGAAGAGAKAMSLLARIQSGQQISTVDELYKRMVLEEPETLAAADAVVQHFDELEGTRQRMLTARSQVHTLAPIRDLKTRIAGAADRLRLIDEVGDFSTADSNAALWRASRRLDLLRDVESELTAEQRRADAALRERQSMVDAAEAEADGLAELLRTSGGDRLETAQRELKDVERRAVDVQEARSRLDRALQASGESADTAKEFAALAERAATALADAEARTGARQDFARAASQVESAKRRVEQLATAQRMAGRRGSNISAALLDSRDKAAQAAGLSPEQLPFVGELLEVQTVYEPWRHAFNLALGGFATTLLIDAARLAEFRTAIDSLGLPARLRYEGVPTDSAAAPEPGDERTLPGRLEYRPSPFTGWLVGRLQERFGYVCVETPADLAHHRLALTLSGQMAQGHRGAHGGRQGNVLGFDGTRRVAELDGELSAAQTELVTAQRDMAAAESALDQADARDAAYRVVSELTWERVDVAGVEKERSRWLDLMEQVTAGNPEIARLQSQIATTKQKAAKLREEIGQAKHARERVEERRGQVADDVDAEQAIVESAADDNRTLDLAQREYLDERFEAPTDPDTDSADELSAARALARFDSALATAGSRLTADRGAAQDALVLAREDLRRTLETFVERWPNPNLLPDPDTALGDFERILDELETSGLADLESEWRASLLTLSGNDLTNLDSTLSRALREIRERIEPINTIMADLPFYDDAHRLRITIRQSQSVVRRRFRAELRDVRELIAVAHDEDSREIAYTRMAGLLDRIRPGSAEFNDLIDVRGHVHVAAERIHAATGAHVALYDHIGEKSGGESQELIAFIVGAALRYQLGDAGAPRPRYAPVFLDEAMIKADAHFTKRAIGAWRGLGFQLVIGAPNDKYSAIEPHVNVEYDILKDVAGRSWAKPKVALPGGER